MRCARVSGSYEIAPEDFNESMQNIEICVSLAITEEDKRMFHKRGIVSQYKKYPLWEKEFQNRLPSYQDGVLRFQFIANKEGKSAFMTDSGRNNPYIAKVFPNIYFIGEQGDLQKIQEDLLLPSGR